MIHGIEILSEYTTGGTPVAWNVIFTILAVLGLIIFLAGCAGEDDGALGVGILVLAISLEMIIIVIFASEPEHTQYKITISDDVNLVEFLEQYEIIDIEGEIYTIREVTEE